MLSPRAQEREPSGTGVPHETKGGIARTEPGSVRGTGGQPAPTVYQTLDRRPVGLSWVNRPVAVVAEAGWVKTRFKRYADMCPPRIELEQASNHIPPPSACQCSMFCCRMSDILFSYWRRAIAKKLTLEKLISTERIRARRRFDKRPNPVVLTPTVEVHSLLGRPCPQNRLHNPSRNRSSLTKSSSSMLAEPTSRS